MLDVRTTFNSEGRLEEKLYYKNKPVDGVSNVRFDFYAKKKEGNLRCLAIQLDFAYAKEHKLPALSHIMSPQDEETFINKVVKREN